MGLLRSILLALPLVAPITGAVGSSNPEQKNVVLILVDDQDLLLDSVSYMPRLQRYIIDQGSTYANHFTTTALCCPARVSLLTGKQAHNTNVTDVDPPHGGYPKFVKQGLNENYLPVWLQEVGYNTYYTGKLFNAHSIHNYHSPYVGGWTSYDALVDPGTYSYLHPITQSNKEEPVYHNRHSTEVVNEKTHNLLAEAIASKRPFFLGSAPIAPHTNIDGEVTVPANTTEPIPLPQYADLFPDAQIPRSISFNPDNPSGGSWVRNLAKLSAENITYMDHFYRQRLRSLQGVEDLIEQTVQQLEEAGILDDTYIIYTTDNGWHMGQHRLPPGKTCGYDEDVHIPMYIRGPGIPAGHVENTTTTHVDIAPSIFRMAGIPLRHDFDGTPMPMGGGDTDSCGQATERRHEHVAVEFWGHGIAEGYVGFDGQNQKTMPNNTYKALRVINDAYSLYYSVWCDDDHELYDMTTDPHQMNNLYKLNSTRTTNTSSPTILGRSVHRAAQRLDTLMMLLKSCKGSDCIEPWNKIHPQGNVKDFAGAMKPDFDAFYEKQPRVSFGACGDGYFPELEGPQKGYEYRNGLAWPHWV